jgi:hypothetical protein
LAAFCIALPRCRPTQNGVSPYLLPLLSLFLSHDSRMAEVSRLRFQHVRAPRLAQLQRLQARVATGGAHSEIKSPKPVTIFQTSLSSVFNIGDAVCVRGHNPADYRQLFVNCLYAAVLDSDADTGSDSSAAAKTFALVIIYKMPPPPLPAFASVPSYLCRVPIPVTSRHGSYISHMLHMVPPRPSPSNPTLFPPLHPFSLPNSHPQLYSHSHSPYTRYAAIRNACQMPPSPFASSTLKTHSSSPHTPFQSTANGNQHSVSNPPHQPHHVLTCPQGHRSRPRKPRNRNRAAGGVDICARQHPHRAAG